MTRSLTLVALAFCAASTASTASAVALSVSGDNGRPSVRIQYANADTQTAAGSAAIAQRIRKAADRVCGGDNPLVRTEPRFRSCRRATIDRVLRDLDAPRVAEALGHTMSTAALR